jgi:hypothetical protein
MNRFWTAFLMLVMLSIGFSIGQVSARPKFDTAVVLARSAGQQAKEAGAQAAKAIEQTGSCLAGWKNTTAKLDETIALLQNLKAQDK